MFLSTDARRYSQIFVHPNEYKTVGAFPVRIRIYARKIVVFLVFFGGFFVSLLRGLLFVCHCNLRAYALSYGMPRLRRFG